MLLCDSIPIRILWRYRNLPLLENDLVVCLLSFCIRLVIVGIYVLLVMLLLPSNVVSDVMNRTLDDSKWVICENYFVSSTYFSAISITSILFIKYVLGPHKITHRSKSEGCYMVFTIVIDTLYFLFNLAGIFLQCGYFQRYMSNCYEWDHNLIFIIWLSTLLIIGVFEIIGIIQFYTIHVGHEYSCLTCFT